MADNESDRRRTVNAGPAGFDERLWPVNCLILILAGVLVAIVVATSSFDDPRMLYNGWNRLASVAVMAVALLLGVLWLQHKMLRRLQFCILFSLLIHICAVVYMHETYLAVGGPRTTPIEQAGEPDMRFVMPENDWQQVEQAETPQSFENPVETPSPQQQETAAETIEQQDLSRETVVMEKPKPAVDEPAPQPGVVVPRRAEPPASGQADQTAGGPLARRLREDRLEPDESIPEAEVKPSGQHPAETAQAATAPIQRQANEAPAVQRQATEPLALRERPAHPQLARQAFPERPPSGVPTAPIPARLPDRPAQVPHADAAVEPIRPAQAAKLSTNATGAAVAKTSAAPLAAGQPTPERMLPGAAGDARLAQAPAHRASSSQKDRGTENAAPSQLAPLARAQHETSPSSDVAAAETAATPAPGPVGGAVAGGMETNSKLAAVGRVEAQTPIDTQIFATGAAEIAAIVGIPHSSSGLPPGPAAVPAGAAELGTGTARARSCAGALAAATMPWRRRWGKHPRAVGTIGDRRSARRGRRRHGRAGVRAARRESRRCRVAPGPAIGEAHVTVGRVTDRSAPGAGSSPVAVEGAVVAGPVVVGPVARRAGREGRTRTSLGRR